MIGAWAIAAIKFNQLQTEVLREVIFSAHFAESAGLRIGERGSTKSGQLPGSIEGQHKSSDCERKLLHYVRHIL